MCFKSCFLSKINYGCIWSCNAHMSISIQKDWDGKIKEENFGLVARLYHPFK